MYIYIYIYRYIMLCFYMVLVVVIVVVVCCCRCRCRCFCTAQYSAPCDRRMTCTVTRAMTMMTTTNTMPQTQQPPCSFSRPHPHRAQPKVAVSHGAPSTAANIGKPKVVAAPGGLYSSFGEIPMHRGDGVHWYLSASGSIVAATVVLELARSWTGHAD